MIICLIPVGQAYVASAKHEKQSEELRNLLKTEDTAELFSSGKENSKQKILPKFEDLFRKNSDLAGWLKIQGTEIDYPVMQCENDEYYLHHNFYREEDKYGCLYVRAIADLDTPGTNFIIYGHNMRDGSMFGELNRYEKESFYKEHSVISFDTLYEKRTYQIIGVFHSTLYREEEFPYYQFYQADTEEEFQEFYENVKKLSLYDTGEEAEYGDTFLTLSTCFGEEEEKRFVVVAKKCDAM